MRVAALNLRCVATHIVVQISFNTETSLRGKGEPSLPRLGQYMAETQAVTLPSMPTRMDAHFSLPIMKR